MQERILEKLEILADAAKYDVSCSSSGSKRTNHNKGIGMRRVWEFVMPIRKMADAYRCLRFYLQTFVFMIARIV